MVIGVEVQGVMRPSFEHFGRREYVTVFVVNQSPRVLCGAGAEGWL